MPIKKSEVKTEKKEVKSFEKGKTKNCPYCDNEIKAVAKKCQYCGEFLNQPKKSKVQNDDLEKHENNYYEYKENSFASFITGTTLNRIGRAKYVARGVIFMLLLYLCFGIIMRIASAFGNADRENLVMIIPTIAFLLVSLYGNIILNNKRLHDIGWSGWCQLLVLVPIANIILLICWYFVPGDKLENQYGERCESKTREQVVTIIYVILLIILFIAGLSSD